MRSTSSHKPLKVTSETSCSTLTVDPCCLSLGHVLLTKPIPSTKGLQQSNGPGLWCELICKANTIGWAELQQNCVQKGSKDRCPGRVKRRAVALTGCGAGQSEMCSRQLTARGFADSLASIACHPLSCVCVFMSKCTNISLCSSSSARVLTHQHLELLPHPVLPL